MTTWQVVLLCAFPILLFVAWAWGYYRGELTAARNYREAAEIKVGRFKG